MASGDPIYAGTGDGYVSSTGATWAVTVAGSGTLGVGTSDSAYTWGTRWPPGCFEHFYAFDLSDIPAGSTITSATLSLRAGDNNMNNQHVIAEVYEYAFGTLGTADWRTGGTDGHLDVMYDAGGLLAHFHGDGAASNAYWVFTSETAFLAAVEDNIGGTLEIVVAPDFLRTNTEPASEWYWTEFTLSDNATNKPRLVVEYTEPAAGNETSVAATLTKLASAATLTNTPPARALSGAAKLGTLAMAATVANVPPARAASVAATLGALASAATLNNGPPARATSAALTFAALASAATLANVPPARSAAVAATLGALASAATVANVPPARAASAALEFGSLVASAVLANVPPARTTEVAATLGSLLAAATVANTPPARATSVLAQLGALAAAGELANVPPARAVSVAATLGALSTAGDLGSNVTVLSAALALGSLSMSATVAWAYYSETGLTSVGRTRGLVGISDGNELTGVGATRGVVSV